MENINIITNIFERSQNSIIPLDSISHDYRIKIIKMMLASRRGHLASALSLVEIIRVLYDDILRYDPKYPKWTERDRFILSKGHGALALYVILAEKGFFPESELWNYCMPNGILGGHPEIKVPGVEASTGSLGHGFSIGIGFALNARYEKSNVRVFVVIGDGEANEGSIWEAALCASKHHLSNLTIIMDYNKQQSYDTTFNVLNLEPLTEKWTSFGFAVTEVDGHDICKLQNVFTHLPIQEDKPSLVICHTIKGKGIEGVEHNLRWHHKSNLKESDFDKLFEGVK